MYLEDTQILPSHPVQNIHRAARAFERQRRNSKAIILYKYLALYVGLVYSNPLRGVGTLTELWLLLFAWTDCLPLPAQQRKHYASKDWHRTEYSFPYAKLGLCSGLAGARHSFSPNYQSLSLLSLSLEYLIRTPAQGFTCYTRKRIGKGHRRRVDNALQSQSRHLV